MAIPIDDHDATTRYYHRYVNTRRYMFFFPFFFNPALPDPPPPSAVSLNDDERRPNAGPAPARPYPMQHMYPELNGDMQSRQTCPHIDEHTAYTTATNQWPHSQPKMSNVHYASSVVAPMYSEERTGNAICAHLCLYALTRRWSHSNIGPDLPCRCMVSPSLK